MVVAATCYGADMKNIRKRGIFQTGGFEAFPSQQFAAEAPLVQSHGLTPSVFAAAPAVESFPVHAVHAAVPAHVQTIVKQVPVPQEHVIPIDNPIYTPVERQIPIDNPVPIVKVVEQPVPIHVEQPITVPIIKEVQVPQPYVHKVRVVLQKVIVKQQPQMPPKMTFIIQEAPRQNGWQQKQHSQWQ